MAITFKRTDLYGGAMRVEIPTAFVDASKIPNRGPVPDHQEVFVDRPSDTSIIVDINERVDVPTVEEALRYHLEDVVAGEHQIKIWQSSKPIFHKLPSGIPSATLMATVHPYNGSNSKAPPFQGILMILARLEHKKTDLLFTINVTHEEGSYNPAEINLEDGNPGARIRNGLVARNAILQTFEIGDWSIFVN